MRVPATVATAIVVVAASGACQSVPAGARPPARGEQLVRIATVSPSSARVTIDGVEAGKSVNGVLWATLRRDSNHTIMVESDGYLPSAQQVKTMPNGHRDGTRTAADWVVGEMFLEPDRLHPESVFFQLVPDPDFRRGATAASPAAAPSAGPGPGSPPAPAQAPDRAAMASALKADLGAGRIDVDEFDTRMKTLYPEALR